LEKIEKLGGFEGMGRWVEGLELGEGVIGSEDFF